MSICWQIVADIKASHDGVTGSCIEIDIRFPDRTITTILVDAGLFQEREYEDFSNSFPFDAKDIDAVLTTHCHVDHIGRLPLLVKNGYTNKIYCTSETSKFLPHALNDLCWVLSEQAKNARKKILYSESDVSNTLKKVVPCEYAQSVQITEHVSATFFKNGHLAGASCILLQAKFPNCDDFNAFFSGDFKKDNIFLDVPDLPDWVYNLPLTMVVESTYGNMDSWEIKETFRENVERHIKDGCTIVTPVFSLGRSQEILYFLKSMQEDSTISHEIPIYFDGRLAQTYTTMYMKGDIELKESMKDFLPENCKWLTKANRSPILASYEPKIIVTSSGMGTYGPAQLYIPRFISSEKSLIQFTGFTPEGTLGHSLKYAEKGDTVQIGGLIKIKNADVEYTTEFSGHAKANELIDFIKKFQNIKMILINHGTPDTKFEFSKRLLRESVKAKDIAILGREHFYRLNAYGLCKQIATLYE